MRRDAASGLPTAGLMTGMRSTTNDRCGLRVGRAGPLLRRCWCRLRLTCRRLWLGSIFHSPTRRRFLSGSGARTSSSSGIASQWMVSAGLPSRMRSFGVEAGLRGLRAMLRRSGWGTGRRSGGRRVGTCCRDPPSRLAGLARLGRVPCGASRCWRGCGGLGFMSGLLIRLAGRCWLRFILAC